MVALMGHSDVIFLWAVLRVEIGDLGAEFGRKNMAFFAELTNFRKWLGRTTSNSYSSP